MMGNRTTTSCSIGRCSTTELCRPGPIWIFNKVSPMILYFGGGIIRILFWGVVTISSPVIQVVLLKTIPLFWRPGTVCALLWSMRCEKKRHATSTFNCQDSFQMAETLLASMRTAECSTPADLHCFTPNKKANLLLECT